MFVVTFYSYKGGVGRTMALVNVAVAEAKLGKKVLVIDFDLEAPGLPSYKAFENPACDRGIVDYITAYRSTGMAPNAAEYITQCDIEGSPVWLMPAGRHTQRGYTDALNAIDWQELYEHQEGYLMFEDLKRQWEAMGFDYVLIDSRTGHTDVGGICTRQLPDAVIIMFLPNEQNIAGLVPIVEGIRNEKSRKRKIALRYCASNVPDLDDEKDILQTALADASKRLRYSNDELTVVKHYSSLEVLTQTAFVQSRPNTRLAKEYQQLREAMIALNFDDAEGARVALERMPADYERARRMSRARARNELRAKAVDIRSRHPQDGEIAYLAARVFSAIDDLGEEHEALSAAIELGHEVNRARLGRAYSYAAMGQTSEAIADFWAIIESPTASFFELAPALQYLQSLDSNWVAALKRAFERPESELPTLFSLGWFALMHREALPITADRMEELSRSAMLDDDQRENARNRAALAMVGSGQFARAKAVFGNSKAPTSTPGELANLFNYLIADWGDRGRIDPQLLQLVYEGFRKNRDNEVNTHQCAALISALAGDEAGARYSLDAATAALQPGDFEFSCWQYLQVDSEVMAADLAAMRQALDSGAQLLPAFFGEVGAGVLA